METTTAVTTKVCSKCGRELPITEFYKNADCADGHIGQCKQCKYEKAKLRRARAKAQQTANTPPYTCNPEFADKTPRELQDSLRKLKHELIARGFNCEVKLTYLQEITI